MSNWISTPADGRKRPTLPGLAQREYKEADSMQNKHHVDSLSAVLQAGVSPTGTSSAVWQFVEPKCAHTQSQTTEVRQGRMWIWMWLPPCGWLGSTLSSKVCGYISGRFFFFLKKKKNNASELPRRPECHEKYLVIYHFS